MNISLTDKQITLIKSSWNSLRGIDPAIIGDVFYDKLLFDHPELKHMFSSERAILSRKLFDMLTLIVVRLDKINELKSDIRQLGIRHIQYGVKENHYHYVGTALIWMLKQALRTEWNTELEEAWFDCYNLIVSQMNDSKIE